MQKAVSGLQIGAKKPCQHSHSRQPVRVRAVAATEVKAGAAAKRKQLGDSDLQVSRKPIAPFVLIGVLNLSQNALWLRYALYA